MNTLRVSHYAFCIQCYELVYSTALKLIFLKHHCVGSEMYKQDHTRVWFSGTQKPQPLQNPTRFCNRFATRLGSSGFFSSHNRPWSVTCVEFNADVLSFPFGPIYIFVSNRVYLIFQSPNPQTACSRQPGNTTYWRLYLNLVLA